MTIKRNSKFNRFVSKRFSSLAFSFIFCNVNLKKWGVLWTSVVGIAWFSGAEWTKKDWIWQVRAFWMLNNHRCAAMRACIGYLAWPKIKAFVLLMDLVSRQNGACAFFVFFSRFGIPCGAFFRFRSHAAMTYHKNAPGNPRPRRDLTNALICDIKSGSSVMHIFPTSKL